MILDIINLEPAQWDKATWNCAYSEYCKSNMFGAKTKREYYDFVLARSERLKSVAQPLSEELRDKWSNGFRNASVWAKNRKCELHIFPEGPHGVGIGYKYPNAEMWLELAGKFLKNNCGFPTC